MHADLPFDSKLGVLQVHSGQVKVELGDPVQISGWGKTYGTVAPRQLQAPLPSFGEAWEQINLVPCLQRCLPMLHHPSR